MIDFARLGLLIVILAFSVQANERAKKFVRERRLARTSIVQAAAVAAHGEQRIQSNQMAQPRQGAFEQQAAGVRGRELFVEIVHPEPALFQHVLSTH